MTTNYITPRKWVEPLLIARRAKPSGFIDNTDWCDPQTKASPNLLPANC